MIQSSLIDYVVAQKKAGVSREVIASALVGVGWQATDVEDTLKKVESDAAQATGWPSAGQTVSRPAQVSPLPSSVASVAASAIPKIDSTKPVMETKPLSGGSPVSSPMPSGAAKSSGIGSFSPMDIIGGVTSPKTAVSQPIRVADFVGATQSSPAVSVCHLKVRLVDTFASGGGFQRRRGGGIGKKVAMIVEIVVILLLAGLSVFLYTQNASLSAKIANLTVSTGGAPAPASDLQGQLQTLTASQATLQGK